PDQATSRGIIPSLVAVSCASTRFCAALDNSGNVVTSSDPAAARAHWSLGRFPAGPVSCAALGLCIVVGDHGNAITSASPTRGRSAWNVAHVGPVPLTAASCPTTALCVAADDEGNVAVGRPR
ncbi:MAG TPA: hypothetical protein VGF81_03250, partial [Solirubrobacteraceae bacterium]